MKGLSAAGIIVFVSACVSCSSSNSIQEHTHFSSLDSLTDRYLVLNDSLLQSWNRLLVSEMDKSGTIRELIDDLDHQKLLSEEQKEAFEIRLDQLEKIRFTQDNVNDQKVVADYDLACNELINDILQISPVENKGLIDYLQKNSWHSRTSYDSLARIFNAFVEKNGTSLKELTGDSGVTSKPVFVRIK